MSRIEAMRQQLSAINIKISTTGGSMSEDIAIFVGSSLDKAEAITKGTVPACKTFFDTMNDSRKYAKAVRHGLISNKL